MSIAKIRTRLESFYHGRLGDDRKRTLRGSPIVIFPFQRVKHTSMLSALAYEKVFFEIGRHEGLGIEKTREKKYRTREALVTGRGLLLVNL